MKKIIIGSMISVFCLSCNVYAEEKTSDKLNDGVTLLQHTETKGERLPEKFKEMPQTNSASTTATAYYSTAAQNSNAYVSGYVTGNIHNQSQSTQVYYVDKYMCVENSNCFHTKDTYQLITNASQSINAGVSTTAYMSVKGDFEDEAIISISGYESNSAKGTNKVHVY